jgi:hypothetical protein
MLLALAPHQTRPSTPLGCAALSFGQAGLQDAYDRAFASPISPLGKYHAPKWRRLRALALAASVSRFLGGPWFRAMRSGGRQRILGILRREEDRPYYSS